MAKHVHCDLIKAWADGYEIERMSDKGWIDVENPAWEKTTQYRIKPRTIKREGWVNIYKGIDCVRWAAATICAERDYALLDRPESCVATVKIEWEEEE